MVLSRLMACSAKIVLLLEKQVAERKAAGDGDASEQKQPQTSVQKAATEDEIKERMNKALNAQDENAVQASKARMLCRHL